MRILGMVAVGAMALAGPAAAAEKLYEFRDFRKIEARSNVSVTVLVGEAYRVEAQVSRQGLFRRLEISEAGDTLRISRRGRSFFMMGLADSYHVTVHVPELEQVSLRAGARMELGGAVTDLMADVSSGASVELDGLRAGALVFEASSGAEIAASGTCETLVVAASSGADIDAEKLLCQQARASASSGGDIEIFVAERLEASVSSGGDIEVAGAPEIRDVRESPGGDVDFVN